MDRIRSYRDLRVYQAAMEAAMEVFELTKKFPAEEKYSLVDQSRRASRSVCLNIAEAWTKRRYPAHFCSKLTDAQGEAEETRVCLEFSRRCLYISDDEARRLDDQYAMIVGQLVGMISEPESWTIR